MSAVIKEKIIEIVETSEAPAKKEKVVDGSGRSYATGKRKNAVARVWIKKGSGKITINDKDISHYFPRMTLQSSILMPFSATNNAGQYDVVATVKGGGTTGQADAVKLGISRALLVVTEDNRQLLRAEGLLTRDSRIVERKKYGLRKARRRPQFSKR